MHQIKVIGLLTILILTPYTFVNAQKNEDKNTYFEKGISYIDKGNYDSSNFFLRKALHLALASNDSVVVTNSLNNIAFNFIDVNKFDSSRYYLGLAMDFLKPPSDLKLVNIIYNTLGVYHETTGDYDSALFYKKKNLAINQELYSQNSEQVASSYGNLSLTYLILGDFEKALIYQLKSYQIRQRLDDESEDLIYNYSNLGVIYNKAGYYDSALIYKEKALATDLEFYGDKHPYVASDYANLAATYLQLGEYEKAENYTLRAHEIRLNLYDSIHSLIAVDYNNLSRLYYAQGLLSQALENRKKALEIYLELFGEHHLTTTSLLGLANIYYDLNYADLAQQTLQKARVMADGIFEKQSIALAEVYVKVADLYLGLAQRDSAYYFASEALKKFQNQLGNKSHFVVNCYQTLSQIHQVNGKMDSALQYIHKSIVSNHVDFSNADVLAIPESNNVFSRNAFVSSLMKKIELLDLLYQETEEVEFLSNALNQSIYASQFLYDYRNLIQGESDKIFLSTQTEEVFTKGISHAYRLYQLTKDDKYLRTGYGFSQQAKSAVLNEALRDSKAQKFTNLPNEIQRKEDLLKGQVLVLRHDLELLESQEGEPSAEMAALRSRLLDAERSYELFIDTLESEYPSYYNLKYSKGVIDYETIQKDFLEKDEAMIDYFISRENLYIHYISQNQVSVIRRPLDDLERQIRGLRNAIVYKIDQGRNKVAAKLYDILFEDVENLLSEDKRVDKLVIVPHAVLGYLPFEVLVNNGEAENPNYLITNYDIRYALSGSLAYEQKRLPNDFDDDAFIAFAPVFSDSVETNFLVNTSHRSMKPSILRSFTRGDKIIPIPATEKEVVDIVELHRKKNLFAKYFIHENALESRIKESELNDFRYIHLATHGFVNDQFPNLSGLILTPHNNLSEDGILYVGEIYGLQWNADLVTLSACETGLGKIVRGEGILGFTRAFMFAGVDNLLVSLWKVSDNSTSILMTEFYNQLLSNKSKSEALRKAKLKLIKSSQYNNPFYWAPFILIGN